MRLTGNNLETQVKTNFLGLFLGLSAKPSAQSFSSLSSEAKMGSTSTASEQLPPSNEASLYEKLVWSHQHDPKSKEDLVLNRRVGFYRFKSDIGAGNFSKVKLAQHQLTKGKLCILRIYHYTNSFQVIFVELKCFH